MFALPGVEVAVHPRSSTTDLVQYGSFVRSVHFAHTLSDVQLILDHTVGAVMRVIGVNKQMNGAIRDDLSICRVQYTNDSYTFLLVKTNRVPALSGVSVK